VAFFGLHVFSSSLLSFLLLWPILTCWDTDERETAGWPMGRAWRRKGAGRCLRFQLATYEGWFEAFAGRLLAPLRRFLLELSREKVRLFVDLLPSLLFDPESLTMGLL